MFLKIARNSFRMLLLSNPQNSILFQSTLEALKTGLPTIVTETTRAKEVVRNWEKISPRKLMEDVENGEIQAFRKKLGNFRSHSTKVRCVKDFKKEFWKVVEVI